jgi:tRNA A-37 threonylcarbamoyl transferase component Bud32
VDHICEEEAKEILFKLAVALNHIHLTDNFVHGDLNCKSVYINDQNEILLVSLGIGFWEYGISKG